MKTGFFSASCAGYRGVLVVATAGLISMALPVLAQDNPYLPNMSATSQESAITQETLDSLLAPIALYPDALLAQVLMAATYPIDVIEAARWQQKNPDLSGQALQDALDSFDWDPSVKSLMTVPQVLQYMNDSPRWMQDLGRAVIEDQPRVMASVQALRQKAYAARTLTSNDKQTVRVDTDPAHNVRYITIAPASPQVVYVPVYDPYVVYGTWWWPSRPFYWGPPPGAVFSIGYFWWPHYYPSVALWGAFHWGIGSITINVPAYYRTHFRAPPAMGPNYAWRRSPSTGAHYYRPPPRQSYTGHSPRQQPSYTSPRQSQPSYAPPERNQRPPSHRASGRMEAPPNRDMHQRERGSRRGDGARGRR